MELATAASPVCASKHYEDETLKVRKVLHNTLLVRQTIKLPYRCFIHEGGVDRFPIATKEEYIYIFQGLSQ